MDSVTIGTRQDRVIVLNNTTQRALSLSWRAADHLGRSMAHKARGVEGAAKTEIGGLGVRRDNDSVILEELGGRLFLLVPIKAALELGYAIVAQARRLDEREHFERIAFDQAILQRSGASIGLTSDPKIQAQAGKEAAWNSDLRRYISAKRLRQKQLGNPLVYGNRMYL